LFPRSIEYLDFEFELELELELSAQEEGISW
jgi:hypothetical protein